MASSAAVSPAHRQRALAVAARRLRWSVIRGVLFLFFVGAVLSRPQAARPGLRRHRADRDDGRVSRTQAQPAGDYCGTYRDAALRRDAGGARGLSTAPEARVG